jgi:amino acid transporter
MNIKRGTLIGLALYATTFIAGIILTIFAKVNLESSQNIPTTYWIITIVLTTLLTCIASIWYFNKSGVKRNMKEGFKLGINFIIVGFVLDSLFFIPVLISNGIPPLIQYYTTSSFYITRLLVIVSATFVGSRK